MPPFTNAGQEIGRAQALQARACGQLADVRMNPVLLKPESEIGSQVIVEGKHLTTVSAQDYSKLKPKLMKHVLRSFNALKSLNDIVVVEGAGSPAEINLREGDIANMGFAVEADVPVILCGDIERGGVIAQIVGTKAVMDLVDQKMVEGFVINKFRGDPSLFDDGYNSIEKMTEWKGLGVVPWFKSAWKLPAEDSMDIYSSNKPKSKSKVVCLCLSRMANFDDLDPISQEPNIDLIMLRAGSAIPGDADLVIIPGTKSTIGDLKIFKRTKMGFGFGRPH
jgi:adenosylcobyric acid synthase